jgi:acetyl-CoA carboxylase biotin carboxyl carrier protein
MPREDLTLDINDITTIVELMKSHDLTHFELDREGSKLTLKRAGGDPEALAAAMAAMRPVAPAAPAIAPLAAPATAPVGFGAPAAAAEDAGLIVVKAPMVGTFYRSSGPGQPTFIEVGAQVTQESVVCIIEAMKVMNEIKAECRGTIVRILVDDATAVGYNTPLFEVRPS